MDTNATARQIARTLRNRAEVDPELSPPARRFGRTFFDSWAARDYGPELALSVPLIGERLGGWTRRTAGRHLSELVDAGYLTVTGRAGGRRGADRPGIVPTWRLVDPDGEVRQSDGEVRQNDALQWPGTSAAFRQGKTTIRPAQSATEFRTPPVGGPLRAPLYVDKAASSPRGAQVVHLWQNSDAVEAPLRCCGVPRCEAPGDDRLTENPERVTCRAERALVEVVPLDERLGDDERRAMYGAMRAAAKRGRS